MTKATAERNATIQTLTEQVSHFRMDNPTHRAHYLALREEFGELAAIMLVSQDAARVAGLARIVGAEDPEAIGLGLELTDPGAVATYIGWTKRNRVVRHGEESRYWIIDPDADTKVGGRIIAMFTRDQVVPAYAQKD